MKDSNAIFKKYLDDSFAKTNMSKTMGDLNNFKNKIGRNESLDTSKLKSFKDLVNKHGKTTKEATSTGSAGSYEPLFSGEEPKKVEAKEATTSASVGAYETPAAWAKSTSKKDWRGKSKTQIPGGSFVSVKKKCKNFPYCNQGDIKSLKIYENEIIKESINNVAKNLGINENVIKSIIQYELENSKNINIYSKL